MGGADATGPTATARVVRVRSTGLRLRKIVLAATSAQQALRAGQFIRVHVPHYIIGRHKLAEPGIARSAGAYVRLPAHIFGGEACVRAYAPSLPSDACDGRWSLSVRLEDGRGRPGGVGKASAWLFGRREGDAVQCTGPQGHFVLKPGRAGKMFVGVGMGVVSLHAMVRERLRHGPAERMHLWIGARREDEVPYLDQILALAGTYPYLSFHLVYSDVDDGDQGPHWGYEAVYEGLLHPHGALAECEFYVCGPTSMVTPLRELLRQIGIAEDQVAFNELG